jgi:uncharacterized protein
VASVAERNGFAATLRGTGPVGILAAFIIVGANLVIAPLGAVLVLIWASIVRVRWSDLGLRRPRSWALTIVGGIISGILLKLLLKTLVMPLLGSPAVNAHFHFIVGNLAQMALLILASIVVGGIGEEVVYRGFLFERLGRIFGHSRSASVAIVLLTTAFFAAIHIPEQGAYGAMQAAFTGLTFATIYAVTRSLWLPMVMHAAYDVAAVVIIYLGVEARVAHAVLG